MQLLLKSEDNTVISLVNAVEAWAYLLSGLVADYCLHMVEDFTHTRTES